MSKKQPTKVGTFLLEQEPALNKIKVSHESGHFSFRIFVPNTPEFFKVWTASEHSRAYEMIFGSIMLFVNFALTNAIYFTEWMAWHNSFIERMQKEVKEATDEEHEAALAEVKDDFEMAERANTTLAPSERIGYLSVDLAAEGSTDVSVEYMATPETARNTDI